MTVDVTANMYTGNVGCQVICTVLLMFAELEAAKKQYETDKKAIDELIRERDILNKASVTMRAYTNASGV